MTLNYQLTNYPFIFKNTYWGNFNNANSNIIENRNRFVEEFKIKRYNYKIGHDLKLHYNDPIFDHVEFYNTIDGKIIIISSPYAPNVSDAKYEYYGFNLYSQLYTTPAITYLKEFDNLKAYKSWFKFHTQLFQSQSIVSKMCVYEITEEKNDMEDLAEFV